MSKRKPAAAKKSRHQIIKDRIEAMQKTIEAERKSYDILRCEMAGQCARAERSEKVAGLWKRRFEGLSRALSELNRAGVSLDVRAVIHFNDPIELGDGEAMMQNFAEKRSEAANGGK